MQRVKILYNKKDSALIQMAEPQQAYLGKSNMPNQPAMLPTTRKSNEKSARSLRQPKNSIQIIKKANETEREREHCSKESNARNDQGLNPKRSSSRSQQAGQAGGQLQFAACLKWKIPATWNSKRCIPLAAIVGSYCCCCCSCKCNKQNVLIIKIVKAKEMARYNDWLQQWAM